MSKEFKEGQRKTILLSEVNINNIPSVGAMQKMTTRRMSLERAREKYSFSIEAEGVFMNKMTGRWMIPVKHKTSEESTEVFNDNSVLLREGDRLRVILATSDAGYFRVIVR